MISRFCFFGLIALITPVSAGTTDEKKEDTIVLSPIVVTAKSRGIIPLYGWFRSSRFTGNLKSPVNIFGTLHPGKALGDYAVEKGEQIIAIDGQRLVGMDTHVLIRLWMETGDAGDPVKLTIRGTGENSSVFREVTVKRIAPPKRPAR